MCKALYVGSFDPFTNGHLNILHHASNIFDEVYVCVMTNPHKKRFVDIEASEQMIKKIIDDRYNNVKIVKAETNLAYISPERRASRPKTIRAFPLPAPVFSQVA